MTSRPGAVPGTVIANTADLAWASGGEMAVAQSNTDRLVVAERLDVRLVAGPAAPAGSAALAIDLVNAGSGEEAFAVAAAPPGDPDWPLEIVVDTDRDGRCDGAVDRALVDGRTAPLAAGETLRLLVCETDGAAEVAARAVTGSGEPGLAFDGRGDGGGDAVVGPTGATATLAVGEYGSGARGGAQPVFVKSQVVLAPDGTARATAGATITYTLAAHFTARAADAEVEDPLPAGTTLVPGSLVLDGAALSDAADADAGEFAGGAIRVRLGDLPAGSDRTVTFAVTVDP